MTENFNLAFEKSITFGQHTADRVATFGGSWIFIGTFFAVFMAWIGINTFAKSVAPSILIPYILFNLILSCLAASRRRSS